MLVKWTFANYFSMRKYRTRIPAPDEAYTELLGSASYVYNYNYKFIIDNIIYSKSPDKNWYELNSRNSKKNSISKELLKIVGIDINNPIYNNFYNLRLMRDRITHSLPCTSKDGVQILNTLNSNKEQYYISNDLLIDFIKKNEELTDLLYEFTDKLQNQRDK